MKLIRQLQPRGPYSLLGWSIGGLVAFETAQQLVAAGEDVAFLGLIETTPEVSLGRLRSALAANSFRLQFNLSEWAKVASGERSLMQFLLDRQSVREAARNLGRLLGREWGALDVRQSDYGRWLNYHYLKPLGDKYELKRFPGRIHLFRGLKEPRGRFVDNLWDWSPFAAGGVDLTFVDGDHFSIFRPPGVHQMAEKIASVHLPAADRLFAEQ